MPQRSPVNPLHCRVSWNTHRSPPTTPHPQPPERLRIDRLPLATALTDNLLGAFATADKTQITASIDNFLGAFGLTDNLEGQVQGL